MAREIFADTSGFYAILVADDDKHKHVLRVLKDARRQKRAFVTTDYVLDETATLLKMRGFAHRITAFFEIIDESRACRIEWMDSARFQETRAFFLKHGDQAWSFTDCMSFLVMKQLGLRDALTKDEHFRQAGYNVLLK